MGYADEREYTFSVERFTGIDQSMEDQDTSLQRSRSAYNCDTGGSVLKPAAGWADSGLPDLTVDGVAAPIRTLMPFCRRNADGSASFFLLAATDNCVLVQSGDGWTDITGPNPVTSGWFSWVNYQKNGSSMIIMANGTDDVYCWTGTGTLARLAADAGWQEGLPTADGGSNLIRLNRHGLNDREMVVFNKDNGSLPSGITEKETYFVMYKNTDSFQVSTTYLNPKAVNLKSNGTPGWHVGRAKWLGSGSPTANPSTNNISAIDHGLENDEEVIFDHFGGKFPSGVKDKTFYFVVVTSDDTFQITTIKSDVDSIVDLKDAGTGDWRVRKAELSKWLPSLPSASAKTNCITMTHHGLTELDNNKNPVAVEFGVAPSTVLPFGLTAKTIYYVKKVDNDSFKLTTTPGGKTIVDVTGGGYAGWAMRGLYDDEWMAIPPEITPKTNLFTKANHGFSTGDPVICGVADENSFLPDGLYAGVVYYAKKVDDDHFKLLALPGSTVAIDIAQNTNTLRSWGVRRKDSTTWLGSNAIDATVDPAKNSICIPDHGVSTGEAVVLGINEIKLMPGGLSTGTQYTVTMSGLANPKDNFQLKRNGVKVNLTSNGRTGWRIRPDGGIWRSLLPKYDIATDVFYLKGHSFREGETVVVDVPNTDGFMPGGIVAHNGTPDGKFYYVVNATKHTFMVATKPGGAPVTITSSGSNSFRVRRSDENRPVGASLALHYERIWAAGERSQPDAVFYSDDLDPTNWNIGKNSAGIIKKPTWDGDAITAVANLFDSIIVFKSKSLFRISGTSPSDYATSPITATVGTVSPATICQWQGVAFYLSPRGIMAFNGTSTELLGGDALKDFYGTMNMAKAALSRACAATHQGHLLVALPVGGSSVNNAVIDFDTEAGTFMVRTGMQVDCWLPSDMLKFATGSHLRIWGQDTAGNRADGYGGAAVSMRWETPESDLGTRGVLKTVTAVRVTGRGGNLKITVKADDRTATRTVTLPDDTSEVKAPFFLRGKRIALTLENVQGSDIVISGFTVVYEQEEET